MSKLEYLYQTCTPGDLRGGGSVVKLIDGVILKRNVQKVSKKVRLGGLILKKAPIIDVNFSQKPTYKGLTSINT